MTFAPPTKSKFASLAIILKILISIPRCDSLNCMSDGVCGVASSDPHKFAGWVYAFVAFGIIGGECDLS